MKILIHYGELALKGKNRIFFEKRLAENIRKALGKETSLLRLSGRFLLKTQLPFSKVKARLLPIFGIAWFAQCEECSAASYAAGAQCEECSAASYAAGAKSWRTTGKGITEKEVEDLDELKKKLANFKDDFKTFAVRVNRVDKDFPQKSPEIEKELGEFIKNRHKKKVNLSNPDKTFWVEILPCSKPTRESKKYRILFFTKKIKGLQGLPVGVSGKLISLLSGGIDSPVASYLMLKRGALLCGVHFHSFPYLDKSSIEKCQEIIKVLRQYQPDIRLFLVPFFKIQKALKTKIDNRYLVVFYRRLMLKLAENIALKEGAGGLVTGESLGQVASQTLTNIGVINEIVSLPVLRPLIGFNKQEIINLAKDISTYHISINPQKDCCSLFVPKHPVTKADAKKVLEIERGLKLEKLLQQALKETEMV